ncbi:MAG: O-antigen ligase family protein [Oscillospiraceae bacterium]|jgi:hypothetical protein
MDKKRIGTLQWKGTISSRTLMYIGIFALLNLLGLVQLFQFSMGALLITGILLLLGFLVKYEELGVYLFLCLAFFNVMNGSIQSTSLFYVLCGIVIVRYLAQEHRKYMLSQKMILLGVIFVITAYNLTDVNRYLSWFILLLTCVLLYREPIVTEKISDIVSMYSLSVLFASWWGYRMLESGMAINNGAEQFLSGRYAYLRFAGMVGDSVMFGSLLLVLIAANLALLLGRQQKTWVGLFFIANMVVLGGMTYSKTFYGGLLIELVLFFWFRFRQKENGTKAFVLSAIAIGVAAGGLSLWIGSGTGNAVSIMQKRMSAEDLSTGRFVAWAYYINRWLNDWTILFKGIGFAEYAARRTFAGYTHSIMYAHNILIESVTAFGLLETAAILAGMGHGLRRFLKRGGELFWLLPAFMLFVVFGMVSHGHFESMFYFSVLLVMTIPAANAKKTTTDPIPAGNHLLGTR